MTKAEFIAQAKAVIDAMENSQDAAEEIADLADIYGATPPGLAAGGEITGMLFDRKENDLIVHIAVRDTKANATILAAMRTDVTIVGENGGEEASVLLSFLSAVERGKVGKE